jgi:hypothetical protein
MQAAAPYAGKIFHSLLMDCLAQQRRPTEAEIDAVASKIWRDSRGAMTGQDWQDVAKGSDAHRQMINAASMALGAPCEQGGDALTLARHDPVIQPYG